MTLDPIIIIGSGLAGYTVAREFRKLDADSPIKIITRDSGVSYSKPMLSNAFAKGKSAEALAMFDAEHMSGQLNAHILNHTTVCEIQTEQHLVITQSQNTEQAHPYSKLVLALGADQVRLPFSGNAADDILTVNDLDDYAAFRKKTDGIKSIAIIGGGLIGCEFANDLISAEHKVHVIELNSQPLAALLPQQAGSEVCKALEASGIHWHLGQSVTQINRQGNAYSLALSSTGDDTAHEQENTLDDIDVVLSAIGLKPRTELAHDAGLDTGRGIVVDRTLKTSIDNIYALGDCAEVDGFVLPYVMPLMNSARALAKTLTEQPTPVNYPAMPVIVKTPACPVVVMPPPANTPGQWTTTNTEGGTKSLYTDDNDKLLGFALTGTAINERNTLLKEIPGIFN